MKQNMRVHAGLTGTGWILEEMAKRLSSALPYLSYGSELDPKADIQYYITYAGWTRRVSPIEVGFFTHLEPSEPLKSMFLNYARQFDYCVTQCQLYYDLLASHGANNLRIIGPGVDLEKFKPKLRVGVVGRTYETGRKGEATIARLMDLDFIDWKFTGSGWPGKSTYLADDELPEFYRNLDVLLISSAYEGGPMCAIEALASGVRVVSTDVGWVRDLPHIPFDFDNDKQLRTIFHALYAEKLAIRHSVLDRSWDHYIQKHDELFRGAFATYGGAPIISYAREKQYLNGWATNVSKPLEGDILYIHFSTEPEVEGTLQTFNPAANLVHIRSGTTSTSHADILEKIRKFNQSSFDVVCCYVEHGCREVTDDFLASCNAVLRPEGVLVLCIRLALNVENSDALEQDISSLAKQIERDFKLVGFQNLAEMINEDPMKWSLVAQKY